MPQEIFYASRLWTRSSGSEFRVLKLQILNPCPPSRSLLPSPSGGIGDRAAFNLTAQNRLSDRYERTILRRHSRSDLDRQRLKV